jgi:hypothetical protein
VRCIFQVDEARSRQPMRQRGLIDNPDRPAVRLQPNAAHRFAIDSHASFFAGFFAIPFADPFTGLHCCRKQFSNSLLGREPIGGGEIAATCQRGGHTADLRQICRQTARPTVLPMEASGARDRLRG